MSAPDWEKYLLSLTTNYNGKLLQISKQGVIAANSKAGLPESFAIGTDTANGSSWINTVILVPVLLSVLQEQSRQLAHVKGLVQRLVGDLEDLAGGQESFENFKELFKEVTDAAPASADDAPVASDVAPTTSDAPSDPAPTTSDPVPATSDAPSDPAPATSGTDGS